MFFEAPPLWRSPEITNTVASQICNLFELPKTPCFIFSGKKFSGDSVKLEEYEDGFLLSAYRNGAVAFLKLSGAGNIERWQPTSYDIGYRNITEKAYEISSITANKHFTLSRYVWNQADQEINPHKHYMSVYQPEERKRALSIFAADVWVASRALYVRPLPKPVTPYPG